jgi:hypothetical protein
MLKPVTNAASTERSRLRRFVPSSDSDQRFVAWCGIAMYLVASLVYNLALYESLGVIRVLVATLLFVAIFGVYAVITRGRTVFSRVLPENRWSWLWAIGVGLFAWASSFPVKSQYGNYYPAFPLNTVDAGGAIAQDTIFHSTLIQSIINFGYPSTGISDVPWVIYHTLSHYVESAIFAVSGLEPFDSAGLFFNLKIMVVVASLMYFVWLATRQRSLVVFMVAVGFAVPILLSRYVIVGSLALWFTTIILIATAMFTYRALSSSNPPSGRTLVALGAVGVVLSFGKVSTGVMYMLVVGIHLFMAHFRDKRIYLLGVGWLTFTGVYGWLFTLDRLTRGGDAISLSERLDSLTTFLTLQGKFVPFAQDLYALGVILGIIALVYRRPTTIRLFTSLVAGFAAVCAMWFLKMNSHDIRYFEQALFFVVLLFAVVDFFGITAKSSAAVRFSKMLASRSVYAVIVIVAILSTAGMGRSPVNVFTPSRSAVVEAFSAPKTGPIPTDPNLASFRTDLRRYMANAGLTARNSLLFIPQEIWASQQQRLTESNTIKKEWVSPLLVYAAIGVPLINGVVAWSDSYGFSAYDDSDAAIPLSNFANSNPCRFNKDVIVVTSWSPATFETQCGTNNE